VLNGNFEDAKGMLASQQFASAQDAHAPRIALDPVACGAPL
jgi:hypothetical protein